MADAQGAAAQEEVKHDVEYANEEGKETVSSYLTYESQLGYDAVELGTCEIKSCYQLEANLSDSSIEHDKKKV